MVILGLAWLAVAVAMLGSGVVLRLLKKQEFATLETRWLLRHGSWGTALAILCLFGATHGPIFG